MTIGYFLSLKEMELGCRDGWKYYWRFLGKEKFFFFNLVEALL